MEPALLARIADELGLEPALLADGEALLAAARSSLQLESAASVREVCDELGIDPAAPSPAARTEEGVPPTSRSALAPAAGGAPPAYADALDLLEDPRKVYAAAAARAAAPSGRQLTRPEWRGQLLRALALRNGCQGDALRDLVELVRHDNPTAGPPACARPPGAYLAARVAPLVVALAPRLTRPLASAVQRGGRGRASRPRPLRSVHGREQGAHRPMLRRLPFARSLSALSAVCVPQALLSERAKLETQLRDLSTHGASSAERDELQQKVQPGRGGHSARGLAV